mmetsp:Transcript_15423/g.18783  ORF Transcript_15423/g.18783 Transcript_15423/m.18783 type:complete len:146 (+) Transcript_15423:273-710(+)
MCLLNSKSIESVHTNKKMITNLDYPYDHDRNINENNTTSPSTTTPTNNNTNTDINKLKILLCSENVPPQVNGIARRIGHYTQGLRKLGHDVELLQPESGYDKVVPHANPWNFTASMMVIMPLHLFELINRRPMYDVVHVVLPLNL